MTDRSTESEDAMRSIAAPVLNMGFFPSALMLVANILGLAEPSFCRGIGGVVVAPE